MVILFGGKRSSVNSIASPSAGVIRTSPELYQRISVYKWHHFSVFYGRNDVKVPIWYFADPWDALSMHVYTLDLDHWKGWLLVITEGLQKNDTLG